MVEFECVSNRTGKIADEKVLVACVPTENKTRKTCLTLHVETLDKGCRPCRWYAASFNFISRLGVLTLVACNQWSHTDRHSLVVNIAA